jgi:transposase
VALRQILVIRQAIMVSRTKAINELRSLIVVAPEHLRASLRGIALDKQPRRIGELDSPPTATIEHRATVLPLRSIAARVQFLRAQTAELDRELGSPVNAHPAGPALLAEPGVGLLVAAHLLVSWSHRGRVRNEAAFASLAGVTPLDASSGQRSRHRLNRGGDRELNRALYTIAITRLRCHPGSRTYEAKRAAQGKTHRGGSAGLALLVSYVQARRPGSGQIAGYPPASLIVTVIAVLMTQGLLIARTWGPPLDSCLRHNRAGSQPCPRRILARWTVAPRSPTQRNKRAWSEHR